MALADRYVKHDNVAQHQHHQVDVSGLHRTNNIDYTQTENIFACQPMILELIDNLTL